MSDFFQMQQMALLVSVSQRGKNASVTRSQQRKKGAHITAASIPLVPKEPKRVKIFISSTFADMTKERSCFSSRVFPQVQQYCDQVGLTLSFVDLRWGVTAQQVRSQQAVEICMEQVSKSDIFVAFLGHRYGWHCAPTASQKDNDLLLQSITHAASRYPWMLKMMSSSITELEMRLAQKVIHPDLFQVFTRKNMDPQFLEPSSIGKERIEQLRQEFAPVAHEYENDSPENLEAMETQLIAVLKKCIDQLFPNVSKDRKWEREKNIMDARAQQCLKGYYPIPKYMQAVQPFMKPSKFSVADRVLLLSGVDGVGKTSLLAHLYETKKVQEPKSFFFWHLVGATADSGIASKITRRLLVQLGEDDPETAQEEDLQLMLFETVNRVLTSSPSDYQLWLFIDGLDSIQGDIFSFLPLKLDSAKLHWCFSVRMSSLEHIQTSLSQILKTEHTSSASSPTFTKVSKFSVFDVEKKEKLPFQHFSLERVKDIDILQQILGSKLASHGKSWSKDQLLLALKYSAQLQDPLYLTLFLSELCVSATFENLEQLMEKTLSSCKNCSDLVAFILSRLESEFGEEHIRDIIFSLMFTKIGLSESEMTTCFGIPFSGVIVTLQRLNQLILDRAGILVADTPLREAAALRYLSKLSAATESPTTTIPLPLQRFHQKIVDYLSTLPIDGRVCRELPVHLVRLGQFESLAMLLTRPEAHREMYVGHKKAELIALWKKIEEKTGKPCTTFLDQETRNLYLESTEDTILLSRLWGCFGRYKATVDLLTEVFEKKHHNNEVASELHRRIAAARIGLGEFTEAMQHAQLALQLSPSPEIHKLLGKCYKKQGAYPEASKCYAAAVREGESYYSGISATEKNLVKLAEIYDEYGDTLTKLSKYPDATRFLKKSLEIKRDELPSNDPRIIQTQFMMAKVLKKQGKFKEVLPIVSAAIESTIHVYGQQHPTLVSMLLLHADCARKTGNFEEALRIYTSAYELNSNLMGPNHIESVESLQYIGLILKKEGRYAEAEHSLTEALSLFLEILTPPHPKIATALLYLGDCKRKMGKLQEALKLCRQSHEMNLLLYSEEHPDIAETHLALGSVQLKLEVFDDALIHFKAALQILESVLGPEHIKCLDAHVRLGDVYRKRPGKLLNARDHYEKALALALANFGEDNIETSDVLYKLGRLQKKLHWYAAAEVSFTKSIYSAEQCLKTSAHPKVGTTKQSLGDVYRNQGKLAQAESIYYEAMGILRKIYGEVHEQVAECINGIGMCHYNSENFEEAKVWVEKGLDMSLKCLDENNHHCVNRRRNLACVLAALQKDKEEKMKLEGGGKEEEIVQTADSMAMELSVD